MRLEYGALAGEISAALEGARAMTLATCEGGRVTARSMATVNDGLTILFQTSGNSLKMRQIAANASVAFAYGNLQAEATARITRDAVEVAAFVERFKVKFPEYYATYSGMAGEVTVVCEPVRFALYRFVDGKPCSDVLDAVKREAYREALA